MDSQSVSLQGVKDQGCVEVHYRGVCPLSRILSDADDTQGRAAIVQR